MFHLPPSRNVRFVSFALALIALTISAALLSHRSSAASAGFNDKPNHSKPASQRFSAFPPTTTRALGGLPFSFQPSAPRPLTPDPTLNWNTFLGGSGTDDGAFAVAVDGSGNVYVVGQSNATWGSPVRPFGGGYDAFVAKLDSSGNLIGSKSAPIMIVEISDFQ